MARAAQAWAWLGERYERLVLRERLLVALALGVLTVMSWLVAVDDPLSEALTERHRTLDGLRARIANEASEQTRLRAALNERPDAALEAEIGQLERELAAIEAQLADTLQSFISPERMPALLEHLLRQHAALELKRVANLPSEPLYASPDDEQASMYRHALRIEFEGRYFDVVAFLAAIESGPWGLRWRLLDYAVDTYPQASVALEIETLSGHPSVLGV